MVTIYVCAEFLTKKLTRDCLMLMAVCGWTLFAPIASADEKAIYQQSIKDISSQIDSVTKNLNADRGLLKTERDKLARIEQQIYQQERLLRKINSKISDDRIKQDILKQQVDLAVEQQAKGLSKLRELIRERYRNGSPSVLKMILNLQNPHAVGRLQNYYQYFSNAQRAELRKLQAHLNKITELREQQAQVSARMTVEQSELQQQQVKLKQARQKRNERINKLDKKVAQTNSQLQNLRKDRNRLNALMKSLVAKAAELERLERERLAQLPSRARPNRIPVKGGFKAQSGRLSQPVSAALNYKYGNRLPSTGMRAQGNFYSTALAQRVDAIFRGRVIFADYLKGYGLLIIVDHGDDHISLYGHNQVLYKQVGDSVTTGEQIASSGTSGGLKSPGLYFEIRHNASPINPNKWFARN